VPLSPVRRVFGGDWKSSDVGEEAGSRLRDELERPDSTELIDVVLESVKNRLVDDEVQPEVGESVSVRTTEAYYFNTEIYI